MGARGEHSSVEVSIPDELSSPRAKLVYLFLAVGGRCELEELKRSLRIDRLSLLKILGRLESAGYVERTDGAYAAVR